MAMSVNVMIRICVHAHRPPELEKRSPHRNSDPLPPQHVEKRGAATRPKKERSSRFMGTYEHSVIAQVHMPPLKSESDRAEDTADQADRRALARPHTHGSFPLRLWLV